MSRIHPSSAPANDGSRTLVLRPEEQEAGPSSPPAAGVLRLRGATADPATRQRRVVWTQDTVDNEHLGRKSSKICCIYHKPKAYDESSDESSSGSSSSESDSDSEASDSSSSPPSDGPTMSQAMKDKRAAKGKERSKAPRHQHDHGADEPCRHEGGGARAGSKARKGGKRRVKSTRNGTMVITKTETEEEHGKDEDGDGDAGGAPDSSDDDDGEAERRKRNAYERGVV